MGFFPFNKMLGLFFFSYVESNSYTLPRLLMHEMGMYNLFVSFSIPNLFTHERNAVEYSKFSLLSVFYNLLSLLTLTSVTKSSLEGK